VSSFVFVKLSLVDANLHPDTSQVAAIEEDVDVLPSRKRLRIEEQLARLEVPQVGTRKMLMDSSCISMYQGVASRIGLYRSVASRIERYRCVDSHIETYRCAVGSCSL